ncbi:hypothetical protein [Catenovulum maritimum]|nr:hypothetical protein [Catenovulum maritimum]
MSHHDEQGGNENITHLLLAAVVTVALPLLPAILGWLNILSN